MTRALIRVAMAVTCVMSVAAARAEAQVQALQTEREKVSYVVGLQIGRLIADVGPDLDVAAFERAVENAVEGGAAPFVPDETRTINRQLMERVSARKGQSAPGVDTAAASSEQKTQFGQLIGHQMGRSLASIKAEVDLPIVLQSVRTVLAKGTLLLGEDEAATVRENFSRRLRATAEERAKNASRLNAEAATAFLARNQARAGVVQTASGLQYEVLRAGTGARPDSTSQVQVDYKGTFLDGTVFDSSYDRGRPLVIRIGEGIAGWNEGLRLMQEGAKYRFWIPGGLAYGEAGVPPRIEPNAMLVFDVELLGVVP